MNSLEFNRLGNMIVALLKPATVSDFQYKLTDLPELSKINCPRSKLFANVSDLLTCKDVIANIGYWVVAEVEGTNVQFNKLSSNTGPTSKAKVPCTNPQ